MIDLKSVYRISLIYRLCLLRQERSCLSLKFIVLKALSVTYNLPVLLEGFPTGQLVGLLKPNQLAEPLRRQSLVRCGEPA